jgi:pimeloyl-ACP methyl ester carboxylesterase
MIPNATLIELPELGHAPQIKQPDRFHDELLKALAQQLARFSGGFPSRAT